MENKVFNKFMESSVSKSKVGGEKNIRKINVYFFEDFFMMGMFIVDILFLDGQMVFWNLSVIFGIQFWFLLMVGWIFSSGNYQRSFVEWGGIFVVEFINSFFLYSRGYFVYECIGRILGLLEKERLIDIYRMDYCFYLKSFFCE